LVTSRGNVLKLSPSLHNMTHPTWKQTIQNFTHPHEKNLAQLLTFNIVEQLLLLLILMVYPLTNMHKSIFHCILHTQSRFRVLNHLYIYVTFVKQYNLHQIVSFCGMWKGSTKFIMKWPHLSYSIQKKLKSINTINKPMKQPKNITMISKRGIYQLNNFGMLEVL
jgi:hypothetical protein